MDNTDDRAGALDILQNQDATDGFAKSSGFLTLEVRSARHLSQKTRFLRSTADAKVRIHLSRLGLPFEESNSSENGTSATNVAGAYAFSDTKVNAKSSTEFNFAPAPFESAEVNFDMLCFDVVNDEDQSVIGNFEIPLLEIADYFASVKKGGTAAAQENGNSDDAMENNGEGNSGDGDDGVATDAEDQESGDEDSSDEEREEEGEGKAMRRGLMMKKRARKGSTRC